MSIESSYAISYYSLIVTLAISATVFEILTQPHPCLTPLLGNPLEFLDETYPTKLEERGYYDVKIS